MKKRNILIIIISVVLILFSIGSILYLVFHLRNKATAQSDSAGRQVYYCAMHPDFISDKPGNCMICGMTLVKKEVSSVKKQTSEKGRKILFYRNPMNPQVTSPVPMKDSMGMDYTPVYEGGEEAGVAGIYISPEKQQLIGVTKEKVKKRHLTHQIITVGEVAYDPDLYIAQEEYLQAQNNAAATKDSELPSVAEQSSSLLAAAQKKLLLLGMSKAQIEELAKHGAAQENLYLPMGSDSAWVYMTVYEYEAGLISEGMPVEIDAIAFPGKAFKGKITAITPVLSAETRSLRARAEIQDPEHKLRPRMFVNARINADLGEKLAVPESGVIDTGMRKIVYVAEQGDTFEQREVALGHKASGYFEVIEGLNEGDTVVTSGNFLVDSESKLKNISQGALGQEDGQ